MFKIPKSLKVTRSKKAERKLTEVTKKWIDRERSPGVHASDLLNPLLSYYRKTEPKKITGREARIFMTGHVFHAFILSAVEGTKEINWESDGGQLYSKDLDIEYAPDKVLNGKVREVKTSRSFYAPRDTEDLEGYIRQCLIYMAATGTVDSQLWVFYINLRDSKKRTNPEYRCYNLRIEKKELKVLQKDIKVEVKRLQKAVDEKDPSGLPLCVDWLCGKNRCVYWGKPCKPKGRYPMARERWEA